MLRLLCFLLLQLAQLMAELQKMPGGAGILTAHTPNTKRAKEKGAVRTNKLRTNTDLQRAPIYDKVNKDILPKTTTTTTLSAV